MFVCFGSTHWPHFDFQYRYKLLLPPMWSLCNINFESISGFSIVNKRWLVLIYAQAIPTCPTFCFEHLAVFFFQLFFPPGVCCVIFFLMTCSVRYLEFGMTWLTEWLLQIFWVGKADGFRFQDLCSPSVVLISVPSVTSTVEKKQNKTKTWKKRQSLKWHQHVEKWYLHSSNMQLISECSATVISAFYTSNVQNEE